MCIRDSGGTDRVDAVAEIRAAAATAAIAHFDKDQRVVDAHDQIDFTVAAVEIALDQDEPAPLKMRKRDVFVSGAGQALVDAGAAWSHCCIGMALSAPSIGSATPFWKRPQPARR